MTAEIDANEMENAPAIDAAKRDWRAGRLAAGRLFQRRQGRKGLRCRLSCMVYTVHPPAILERLAAFQDGPRPSNCAGDIAVFVDQPDTTGAQRYRRSIDLFPRWIASLLLPPLPSLSNSLCNHREILAFAQRNFRPTRPSCLTSCFF